jgi:hypothetical protein
MTTPTPSPHHPSRFTFHVSRFAPLFAFPTLLLLFFHKMAFTNLILARGDTFLYFYPYWQAAADALRTGRLPLWNPHLFMGAPFLANSQVGFFYPLNWPLWLLLPTPYAVSASILLHLFIAGLGTYLAGRRALGLSPLPALLSAVLFALGGYLTAQVEHVNQLQGLAWLPWFFVALAGTSLTRRIAGIAALFSLQLLAGHTQTTFITAFALLIWLTGHHLSPITHRPSRFTFHASRFTLHLLPILLGGFLALLIAAIQLLPTLELAGQSSRQGGLPFNEVVSFSLNPLLLSQALLPGYGRSLFSEYVAFLPITALLLAIIGAWRWRQEPAVRPVLLLAVVGLLLALGIFNPFYWLLGRLPIFDLFRAPARWLALYALGTSLLAGMGLQQAKVELNHASRITHHALRVGTGLILALMLWSAVAVPLARFVPVGQEAAVVLPTWYMVVGWLVELVMAWLFLSPSVTGRFAKSPYWSTLSPCLPGLAVVSLSLFLASRSLPYNNLTTPEAYFDLRPPITRLQAASESSRSTLDAPRSTPARFLSLSGIFFDPGDQAEIDTIYADQLPPAARYDYTIAIKQKEVIGPNLSLVYGLEAVDGFDGGLLPLRTYTSLTSLILPGGQLSTDGRLREYLEEVPAARWLDLFNARYLITDKVGDAWHEGVFFDLQHPITLTADETAAVGYLPQYEATELWLAAEGQPGQVEIMTENGQTWQLAPESLTDTFYHVVFPQPAVAQSITLSPCYLATPAMPQPPCPEQWSIAGLTLVDNRDETFHPLILGQYRLIHSGDVKIYENLDVLPRAFLVNGWQWQPDLTSSAAAIADPAFNFRQTAVLVGPGEAAANSDHESGTATITHYTPERVEITTESTADTLLLLTDAWYPGWQATVDGQPAPIYQANVLFRAVFVPAGTHEIIFTFVPTYLRLGVWLSAAGLVMWLILITFFWRGRSFGAIVTPSDRSEP